MQPRDVSETAGAGLSREDKVKGIIEDLLDKIPEEFNIPELLAKVIIYRICYIRARKSFIFILIILIMLHSYIII